jgi:hypothetical protein
VSRDFPVSPDLSLSDGVEAVRRWRPGDAPALVRCLGGEARVSREAGFRREGVLRGALWHEQLQRRVDHALYWLLPEDVA